MIRKDESKDKTKTRFSKWVLPCLGKIIKIQMICKKKTGNWRKGLRCGHEYPSIEQAKRIAMQGFPFIEHW